MRDLYRRHFQGKKVLGIFIITNVIYLVMLFITIPHVLLHSSGMNLFDMMPGGYSVEYAHTLLHALGTTGRSVYMNTQLPVDMIYPAFFGLTYSLMLAYFLDKITWFEKPVFFIVVLPILAALFDYAENLGIYSMLRMFPDFSPAVATYANTFTVMKSVMSTISFIALLIIIAIFLVRKMTPSPSKTN